MKPNCTNKQTFNPPPAGNSRPGNRAIASKGRNFGGNNNGRKGKQFGKLNCTTLAEVVNSEALIGTLEIMTYSGKVLFDTGATTSFMSKEFIDANGLECKTLA